LKFQTDRHLYQARFKAVVPVSNNFHDAQLLKGTHTTMAEDPEDLDDILDRALEEFEEEELNKISTENAASVGVKLNSGGLTADQLLKEQHAATVTQELHKMIANLEDPAHAEVER